MNGHACIALYMYTKHVVKMPAKEDKDNTALAIFMFSLERPCLMILHQQQGKHF